MTTAPIASITYCRNSWYMFNSAKSADKRKDKRDQDQGTKLESENENEREGWKLTNRVIEIRAVSGLEEALEMKGVELHETEGHKGLDVVDGPTKVGDHGQCVDLEVVLSVEGEVCDGRSDEHQKHQISQIEA